MVQLPACRRPSRITWPIRALITHTRVDIIEVDEKERWAGGTAVFMTEPSLVRPKDSRRLTRPVTES